ncbi:MAG TPA: nitroreductase [Methanotrichaceae archaeon]|nr:nitroreductase [Methanotrichaceae archaeon]
MDVSEAIQKRRSIRKYQGRQIEEEKLDRVLEAGRLAPSARNLQEWKFVIVRDEARRKRIAEAAKGQTFVGEAPVVIAACATVTDYVMTCGQLTYPIDLAIAVDHMTLKAVEEGLGTCWIGAFYEEEVKKVLNIPPEVRVVALLPIGYPDESPNPRPRKEMEEIVAFETW